MFEEVEFCGAFRSYRQKIPVGAKGCFGDVKINVAEAREAAKPFPDRNL